MQRIRRLWPNTVPGMKARVLTATMALLGSRPWALENGLSSYLRGSVPRLTVVNSDGVRFPFSVIVPSMKQAV